MDRKERYLLAEKRLCNILQKYIVASGRTLEQKISDAGPTNQRIDPHILTVARKWLIQKGTIQSTQMGGIPWFYLSTEEAATAKKRLSELDALHRQTQKPQFVMLLG